MPTEIHPTALIADDVTIGNNVRVGAFAVIGDGVTIGDGCTIDHHADVRGPLEIGPDCVIGFSAAIGHDPQIKGGDASFGATRIGARNVFREFSQVHRSRNPQGTTVIGDDGYFMTYSHVAHDCRIENDVTLCSGVVLAGHVHVEDRAFFGGLAGIHQFCRVGTLSMIGGHAGVSQDVPPYGMVVGIRPPVLEGINAVGIRRARFTSTTRMAIKAAFRTLFRSEDPLASRLDAVEIDTPEVAHLVDFVRASKRGVVGVAARGSKSPE